jgi:peptidoglycan/xylan/chitin deacetylase (PgdA/CDA1 family)
MAYRSWLCTIVTAAVLAARLAAPAAAAEAPPTGATPAVVKLDRRSLAPSPDHALPHGGGTVSPARIADQGWRHCALTFDDGPNEVTPRILALLDREQVAATYFPVAATAARHPAVIRGFIAGGHEIGNHSLAHGNLAKLSPAAQRADLAEANRILRGLGAQPALFRPPYAGWDARLIESARAVGLETVLWNLDARDWEFRDAGMLAARVDAGAGPALVVLLHATYPWTERALPAIIAALRGHGCRFVTLSEWLAFMQGGRLPPRPPVLAVAADASPAPALAPVALPRRVAPPAPPRPAPAVLALRPASLAPAGGGKTVVRIEGDDVFLQLGPDADLDAIAAQIKEALERPRR